MTSHLLAGAMGSAVVAGICAGWVLGYLHGQMTARWPWWQRRR